MHKTSTTYFSISETEARKNVSTTQHESSNQCHFHSASNWSYHPLNLAEMAHKTFLGRPELK